MGADALLRRVMQGQRTYLADRTLGEDETAGDDLAEQI